MPRKRGNPNFGKMATPEWDGRPTEWEQMARKLGIAPEQALGHVESNSPEGIVLRRFARDHARYKFVPEDVLTVLGINPAEPGGVTRGWWD
jgi:hypothetical protein